MVSAVKVGGRGSTPWPARASRSSGRPDRSPSPVRRRPGPGPGVFRVEVECSSGTYVRVLAADLGRPWVAGPTSGTCGAPASARSRWRTPAGRRADPGAVLTPAQALRDLDQVVVTADVRQHTSPAAGPRPGAPGCGRGRPLGPGRRRARLLAVYEATETDRIRPAVVLESAGVTDGLSAAGPARTGPGLPAAAVTFPGDGHRDRPRRACAPGRRIGRDHRGLRRGPPRPPGPAGRAAARAADG
jgi:hypothetical protein